MRWKSVFDYFFNLRDLPNSNLNQMRASHIWRMKCMDWVVEQWTLSKWKGGERLVLLLVKCSLCTAHSHNDLQDEHWTDPVASNFILNTTAEYLCQGQCLKDDKIGKWLSPKQTQSTQFDPLSLFSMMKYHQCHHVLSFEWSKVWLDWTESRSERGALDTLAFSS